MAKEAATYEINRGRTTIRFPHAGTSLVAVHPFYGPNTAKAIHDAIRTDATLREPTAPETISFLETIYVNEQEPEFREAKGLMRTNYFRGFTGIVRNDEQGTIYCIDFPEFNPNGKINLGNLLERIGKSEKGIRSVPISDIRTGYQSPSDLAKNKFVRALLGDEGAEKAARLAENHPEKRGYVWAQEAADKPVARIAALGSYDYGRRLFVVGDDGELDDDGCAFGVLGSREAGAPKKE